MDQLIRHVTDEFVNRLPEAEDYYRLQSLESYGFPPFLVRRMHIELQWNLDESMRLPQTDWANIASESVQHAWQQFLQAIHAEVQLPASYARAIIETAVADVIEILVQPRKCIPEILFGGEEVLTSAELEERTELLVVYSHFARVLTTYMDRRQKEELERSQCKQIIQSVDARITSGYTPLQWAQMLDPLFTLAGSKISSNIFRLFFEDNERPRMARAFDQLNEPVTRAQFIEVLSSPDRLNYEGLESDQPQPSTDDGDVAPLKQPIPDPKQMPTPAGDEDENDSAESEPDTFPEEEGASPVVQVQDEFQQVEAEAPKKDEEDKEPTDEPQAKSIHDVGNADSDVASLNDRFFNDDDEQEGGDESEEDDENPIASWVEDEEPASVSPMWQRFLDSEPEEEATEWQPEADDDPPAVPAQHDRIADTEQRRKQLAAHLNEERGYYIETLFNGSEKAYEDALRHIAQHPTWRAAGLEIGQQVFTRNEINMYSEPAVDFTDRLQSFYIDEKK